MKKVFDAKPERRKKGYDTFQDNVGLMPSQIVWKVIKCLFFLSILLWSKFDGKNARIVFDKKKMGCACLKYQSLNHVLLTKDNKVFI